MFQHAITRTTNAPQVTITDPPSGAALDENTIIKWDASDADNDTLTFSVQYSHDGAKWIPLASNLQAFELALDPSTLPATSSNGAGAEIRVTASDGFNTVAATVSNLELDPNQPPTAVIISPFTGRQYRARANTVFHGLAYDPEDGYLSGPSLGWVSSIDGPLGSGGLLNLDNRLSLGTHTITLAATDSQSAQSTSSVSITIVP